MRNQYDERGSSTPILMVETTIERGAAVTPIIMVNQYDERRK
jgi:hypothetical protein